MRELRGTTFDPVVLDAFFEIEDEIRRIAACFRDEDEDELAGAGLEASSVAAAEASV
jgi:HD-GYP domain-containing protein (c-di-GMP phosphodiesterase class II)